MLLKVGSESRGQESLLSFRFNPKTHHDDAKACQASPLVNHDGGTDDGKVQSRIDGVAKACIGPGAD
jgi:hypothetical protein